MKRPTRGFSLLEIMIVTLLVSVLLTLAVPAYRDQGSRVYRAIAVGTLLQAASCQEQLRAARGFYDTGACRPADSSHYRYRYEPSEPGQTATYTLVAEPQGAQSHDECGWLSLDEAGRQAVEQAAAGAARCWSGR
ncbi:MAG TPA: type IV pilin protein [Xanthomonadales bacterium]|nr:type IV pilin protein [Xanthomonadales bacterium]